MRSLGRHRHATRALLVAVVAICLAFVSLVVAVGGGKELESISARQTHVLSTSVTKGRALPPLSVVIATCAATGAASPLSDISTRRFVDASPSINSRYDQSPETRRGPPPVFGA